MRKVLDGLFLVIFVVLVALLVLTAIWFYYSMGTWMFQRAGDLAQWAFGSRTRKLVVALVVLGFAGILYYFREGARFAYGALECMAGMMAVGFACSHHDRETAGVAIIGAVYFIVRGIDNMATARRDWPIEVEIRYRDAFREVRDGEAHTNVKTPPGRSRAGR